MAEWQASGCGVDWARQIGDTPCQALQEVGSLPGWVALEGDRKRHWAGRGGGLAEDGLDAVVRIRSSPDEAAGRGRRCPGEGSCAPCLAGVRRRVNTGYESRMSDSVLQWMDL